MATTIEEERTDVGTLEVTDTVTKPVDTDSGDHDRFSHYVKKDQILPSAFSGTPIRALCGKKWVPNRDPEKFPVCPDCKDIIDQLFPES